MPGESSGASAALPVDAVSATELAKAALRRLAAERAAPTPANYARAYAQEQGTVPPPAAVDATADTAAATAAPDAGPAWSALIDRLVRGLERGGRQWTSARKKESLHRVLQGSRADAGRLLQRLDQLIGSWDGDDTAVALTEAAAVAVADKAPAAVDDGPASVRNGPGPGPGAAMDGRAVAVVLAATATAGEALGRTVEAALSPVVPAGDALAAAILGASRSVVEALGERPADDGGSAPMAALRSLCHDARVMIGHRHQAFEAMGQLCRELTASLGDLAEDDSWAQGQCAAMQTRLDEGLTPRGVRSVSALLHDTRQHQHRLRAERAEARAALKSLIQRLLAELGELGTQTGRFQGNIDRHAAVIEQADTLEGLTEAVRALVEESRGVQSLIGAARQRIDDERALATRLNERVATLEAELRRLSDEVVTDQLTQVANRRGLVQAFRCLTAGRDPATSEAVDDVRGPPPLCVGLLDVDNFKRLNDQFGHAVGDEALKALAAAVAKALRPTDIVGRYGGEEFVVLLPATAPAEGRQILTRLQRSLSGGLFLHEGKQVFVTFSAGVTGHLSGEAIEDALERADRALYDAKRAGKNRTCVA